MRFLAISLLLAFGWFGCKPAGSPAQPIAIQQSEISMTQMENFVRAGKAVKAGSNHSGAVWVEDSGGQVFTTKNGRPDFQEFVKQNAPKPVDFYIE